MQTFIYFLCVSYINLAQKMKRIEFISFEEFKKIYKEEKNKQIKLALLLGFGSGLRISEIIGLKQEISRCCNAEIERKRIKEEGKTLKKYFCSKCKNEIILSNVKRDKNNWKIPPLTVDKIDLKTHQIRIDIAKGNKWRVTVAAPLLSQELIKLLPLKIPRRTLQDKFDKLTLRVLGKKMSFHILRHGFGNYQVNVLNVPLPIVQQMMGHSRLDTTGVYTKANPDHAISVSWKAMTE